MVMGMCYCLEIQGYKLDLIKLNAAKAGIKGIDSSLTEVDFGLNQLKAAVSRACNVDMKGFTPHTFLASLTETCSSGFQMTDTKRYRVQSDIDTMTVKDKNYHRLLIKEMEGIG